MKSALLGLFKLHEKCIYKCHQPHLKRASKKFDQGQERDLKGERKRGELKEEKSEFLNTVFRLHTLTCAKEIRENFVAARPNCSHLKKLKFSIKKINLEAEYLRRNKNPKQRREKV